jgi:hypothetical protein
MPVPQWTITDFTYRESWWKNRGTSFVKCLQIHNVLDPRHPDAKHLLDITALVIDA